jgi:hypothetical protein
VGERGCLRVERWIDELCMRGWDGVPEAWCLDLDLDLDLDRSLDRSLDLERELRDARKYLEPCFSSEHLNPLISELSNSRESP